MSATNTLSMLRRDLRYVDEGVAPLHPVEAKKPKKKWDDEDPVEEKPNSSSST